MGQSSTPSKYKETDFAKVVIVRPMTQGCRPARTGFACLIQFLTRGTGIATIFSGILGLATSNGNSFGRVNCSSILCSSRCIIKTSRSARFTTVARISGNSSCWSSSIACAAATSILATGGEKLLDTSCATNFRSRCLGRRSQNLRKAAGSVLADSSINRAAISTRSASIVLLSGRLLLLLLLLEDSPARVTVPEPAPAVAVFEASAWVMCLSRVCWSSEARSTAELSSNVSGSKRSESRSKAMVKDEEDESS
mmetsp:Transcript_24926/g.37935  ORF Transcript_24926/g.37935 Transcript_24926/m.37935 type:complete len:253 (-) Transcript_24926:133-891(-)